MGACCLKKEKPPLDDLHYVYNQFNQSLEQVDDSEIDESVNVYHRIEGEINKDTPIYRYMFYNGRKAVFSKVDI